MYKINKKPFREKFRFYLFFLFLILVIIYSIFKMYNYLSGPKINIYNPQTFQIINGNTFTLSGNIKNAKNIYINGREINIDQFGNFSELLIAKSPYTLITIRAVDIYGKEKNKTLFVGKE